MLARTFGFGLRRGSTTRLSLGQRALGRFGENFRPVGRLVDLAHVCSLIRTAPQRNIARRQPNHVLAYLVKNVLSIE